MTNLTLIKSRLSHQGGLEKYTWELAKDFCALGISVTLLTSGEPKASFNHSLLKMIFLKQPRSLGFLKVMSFDKACACHLKNSPTPIVFGLDRNRFQTHLRAGNGVHAAYLQRRAEQEGLLKKTSFILNPLHRTILSYEKKAFENPGLKILFTNSEMVKREVVRFYSVDPKKIRVVHNGVEWKAMQSPFENWESRKEYLLREWGLNPKSFQFLFIGHNYHRKGLEKLFKALAFLRKENFQLSVVGKDKNIPYFHELAHRTGLAEKVFFFGPQACSLPFYQLADCTVIPSLYDPFANVTIESLAMGVPVISSSWNGGHEILTSSNGWIVNSLDDSKAFSQILCEALAKPKNTQIAQNIRNSVEKLDFSHQLRAITQSTIDPLCN